MKKHFPLFFIYCAVIIAALSLFLVFYNKKEVETPNSTQEVGSNNPSKEEDDNLNESEKEDSGEDNIIYATKLNLNCARSIDLSVNSSVEIVGDYLNILPSEATVTITISADSGIKEDLTFKNNVITTKGKGRYRIKFTSPKNKTTELNDTLIVNVKENISPYILPKLSVLTVGETKTISEIFSIDNSLTDIVITTDGKLNYKNNKLTAVSVGESVINITYKIGMFKFNLNFNITIKNIPEYKIILTGVSSGAIINGNTINYSCEIGKSLHIYFAVFNRDEEYVNQFVNISLSDESIATYTLTEPLIKIKCLNKGSVSLTITCDSDENIKLTLTINFV